MDTINSILSPLYIAVSWIIIRFHSLYSLIFDENSGWAWGLSIVSLVIVVRICLIPLFVRQIKATRNMQALQPQMKKIQERYKNDRQRQSEEMMKLYRETGTNPLASCLPILAQSPFFIALFQTLSHIANDQTVGVLTESQVTSARQATIFGAPIASRFLDGADKVAELGATLGEVRTVTIIMIVLMSASQFFTQRQLMTKNVDLTAKTPFMNQQKMLMYVFPLMFAVFGINFPVGVLIYWLTTNVWSMGQQLYVIQRNPTPGSLAYQQRQERLRKKGKLPQAAAEAEAKKADAGRAPRSQPRRQTKAQRQGGQPPRTPRTPDAPRLEKSTDRDAGAADGGERPAASEGRNRGAQQGRQAGGKQPAKKSPQGKTPQGKSSQGKTPQGKNTPSAKSKK